MSTSLKAYQKKSPPPGLLLALGFFQHKKQGIFSVLGFRVPWLETIFSSKWCFFARLWKNILNEWWTKPGETRFFVVSWLSVFWPLGHLMVTFLFHILSCLQLCPSSLLSYFGCHVSLVFGVRVIVLTTFVFSAFTIFRSVVSLLWIHSWVHPNKDEITETPLFQVLFLMLSFCLWISMLIPHNNLAVSNWKQGRKKTEWEPKRKIPTNDINFRQDFGHLTLKLYFCCVCVCVFSSCCFPI